MAERLTRESIRADIAEVLHGDPGDRENLFECGLDSVRLLTLLERWREHGVTVSFVELAEEPTMENWLRILTSRLSEVLDA